MTLHEGADPDIAFFSPDITDVSTIKRADMFIDSGFSVVVFGFRRARYNRDFRPQWPYVELGETRDRSYLQRAMWLLRATIILTGWRDRLKRASRFYARNIDQLMLAFIARALVRSRAPITYEVLDIQPTLSGEDWRARLLRFIERLLLKRVSLLVVSSPGFIRNYFEPMQVYRGDWFLLENKLDAQAATAMSAVRKNLPTLADRKSPQARKYRWVVSYAGLIRGQRTFDLIRRLARRFEDEVLFKFHGVLTTVDPLEFQAAVAEQENMLYCGEYVSPRDLADIYRDTDFVWALDLENIDGNSRWLLPCRLYEAGYLGLPCLAARDFEVGRKIEELRAGWTFPAPFEAALSSFFATVTPDEYEETRRRVASLPPNAFLSKDETSAFCQYLSRDEAGGNFPPYGSYRTRARQLLPEDLVLRE